MAAAIFVLLGAWAVAGAIEDATARRWMRTIILVLGVPLTILSGPRLAWLAIGVAGAVLVVPWLWQRRGSTARRWRPSRRALIALAALALAIAATVVLVAPRALSITSLVYRGDLWRDTINAWSHNPITGIGPGHHAVRAPGGGARLLVPGQPTPLRTTWPSASWATPASSGWRRQWCWS